MSDSLAPASQAPAASPGGRAEPDREPSSTHRLMLAVAAVTLTWPVWQITFTAVEVPATAALGALGIVTVLGVLVGAATASRERTLDRLDVVLLVLGLLVLAGLGASQLYGKTGYPTDEAAFVHYSAELWRNGVDPYGANLLPALEKFQLPSDHATFTLEGMPVGMLSYPALPVLVTAALLPITGGVHTVAIADIVALALTAVLFHLLLPRKWRSLGVLVAVGLPALTAHAHIGIIAVMMTPFMVVVAHRWNATGSGGRLSRGDLARAACLGLACATNQLAWFIVPFLLAGLFLLRRGELPFGGALRTVGWYTGVALAVFALVNAPFLISGPGTWLTGVTEPLTQHALPLGQAAIAAPLFLGIGGGNLEAFTLSGAAVYAALGLAYVLCFRRLGPACFILPTVAFVFPARSLMLYFATPVAIWLMSVAGVDRTGFAGARQFPLPRPLDGTRTRAAMALGGFVPGLALLATGLLTPEPLKIHVVKVEAASSYWTVGLITADVTNTSDRPLEPKFNIYDDLHSRYWTVRSGPASLAPGASATYELSPPDLDSTPRLDTPFRLQALTSLPATLSSTGVVTQPYRTVLSALPADRPARPDEEITVTAQLRDAWGSPVRKGGVRVGLEQTCFAATGTQDCHAAINGAPAGASPRFALTGPDGSAVFRLRTTQPGGETVSLRSWVQKTYRFGYSPSLTVHWSP